MANVNSGLYYFAYNLPNTKDQYGNYSVFYTVDENNTPQAKGLTQISANEIYPVNLVDTGAIGAVAGVGGIPVTQNTDIVSWVYYLQRYNVGGYAKSYWADLSGAGLSVQIRYTVNGVDNGFVPPVGNPDTTTTVVATATMVSPAQITFPSITYTINPLEAQQTVLQFTPPSSLTYNGTYFDLSTYVITNSPQPIIMSYVGVGATVYGPSSSPPKDSGTYSVTASQNSSSGYSAASSTVAFTISPISEILNFQFGTTQAYYNNGNPLPITCITNPVGLSYNVLYNGSSAVPSAIGSYIVQAQISDRNVSPSANGAIITGIYNIVRSNQIPSSAPNSTTIVRATYSAAIDKFLVDFVGTYQ